MSQPAEGPPSIFPCLFYRDALQAFAWLERAFGFRLRMSVPGENGRIEHAELTLGNGVIMAASTKTDKGWVSPLDLPAVNQVISVYVADPDAHCRQAQAAGAEITQELKTEDYGARGYCCRDLEGNHWYFGNYQPGGYWDR